MASWMNSNSELDLGLIGAAGGVRGRIAYAWLRIMLRINFLVG